MSFLSYIYKKNVMSIYNAKPVSCPVRKMCGWPLAERLDEKKSTFWTMFYVCSYVCVYYRPKT